MSELQKCIDLLMEGWTNTPRFRRLHDDDGLAGNVERFCQQVFLGNTNGGSDVHTLSMDRQGMRKITKSRLIVQPVTDVYETRVKNFDTTFS